MHNSTTISYLKYLYSLILSFLVLAPVYLQAQTDTLDFTEPGYSWSAGTTSASYTLTPHTINISVDNPDGILIYAWENNKGIRFRINPTANYLNEKIYINYSFDPPLQSLCFDITDLERKTQINDSQHEHMIVSGYLAGAFVMPTLIPADTSVTVTGNLISGDHNGDSLGLAGRVDVSFLQPIDSMRIEYRSGPNVTAPDPSTSSAYIGRVEGMTINGCQPIILNNNWLSDFRVSQASANVLLDWKLKANSPLSGLSLMRSFDGINFSQIADYTFENNVSGEPYHFEDTDASRYGYEQVYYQLVMIGLDASEYKSDVRQLQLSNAPTNSSLHIYPNPASQSITLTYDADLAMNSWVEIIDMRGRICLRKALTEPIYGKEEINLKSLKPGVYHVWLKGGSYTQAKKLLVR